MRLVPTLIGVTAISCGPLDETARSGAGEQQPQPLSWEDWSTPDGEGDIYDLPAGEGWTIDQGRPGASIEYERVADWWPAEIYTGTWSVEVESVYSNSCDFELEDAFEVEVSPGDPAALLWGFAPVITDGDIVSVAGQTQYEDGSCTTSEIREARGSQAGAEQLLLDVTLMLNPFGESCGQSACTAEYLATYTWQDEPLRFTTGY